MSIRKPKKLSGIVVLDCETGVLPPIPGLTGVSGMAGAPGIGSPQFLDILFRTDTAYCRETPSPIGYGLTSMSIACWYDIPQSSYASRMSPSVVPGEIAKLSLQLFFTHFGYSFDCFEVFG